MGPLLLLFSCPDSDSVIFFKGPILLQLEGGDRLVGPGPGAEKVEKVFLVAPLSEGP